MRIPRNMDKESLHLPALPTLLTQQLNCRFSLNFFSIFSASGSHFKNLYFFQREGKGIFIYSASYVHVKGNRG